MKTKIKISGVIARWLGGYAKDEYSFLRYASRDHFDESGLRVDSFGDSSLFIADHTIEIEVDLPNVEQAQIKSLDAKENVLREKFAKDMMNIKVERSKLMALTNEVQDD